MRKMKNLLKIVAWVPLLLAVPTFGMNVLVEPPAFTEIKSSSQINLLSVADTPNAPWVLIKVQPDKLSGVGVINDVTAKIVTQTANTFGTYEVIAQLGSQLTQTSGTYSWPVLNPFGDQRYRVSMDRYNELSNTHKDTPRYFLCQLNVGAKGSDLFTNVTLVPDEWTGFIKPAVDFIRSNSKLQTADGSTIRNNQAVALLKGKNPYLVLTAAQILISEGQFSQKDMDTVLTTQDTALIGTVVADANIGYFQGASGTIGQPSPAVIKTASIGQLEGIVFGISTAPYLFSAVTMYKGTQPLTTTGPDYNKRSVPLHNFANAIYSSVSNRLDQLSLSGVVDPRIDVLKRFCIVFGNKAA